MTIKIRHIATENGFLELADVTIRYGTDRRSIVAIFRISFRVGNGERYVIVGPSGCGKSSLLKAIAGFVAPFEGTIRLGDRVVDRPGPDRILVFQEFDQLLAWKTVEANVVFALSAAGRCRGTAAVERARHCLEKVGLRGFGGAYPHTLSGGMKQRVALARAMALSPQVLLLDEPFAALDALTRERMNQELLQLCSAIDCTMLLVTHSIEEACTFGERILVLSAQPGRRLSEFAVADYSGRFARQHLGRCIRELLVTDRGEPAELPG